MLGGGELVDGDTRLGGLQRALGRQALAEAVPDEVQIPPGTRFGRLEQAGEGQLAGRLAQEFFGDVLRGRPADLEALDGEQVQADAAMEALASLDRTEVDG